MYFQKDIVFIDLSPVIGSEQSGIRPCIIISGNNFHASGMVIVIPLTTKIKNYPCNVLLPPNKENNLDSPSECLIGQIRTVSFERIREKRGEISDETLRDIFFGFDSLCAR